jgi:hypothetical protein
LIANAVYLEPQAVLADLKFKIWTVSRKAVENHVA